MASDEELFSAYAQRKDVKALSELIARHERRLMAFLSGLLGVAEAEDAFQEVWCKVMAKASSYRGGVFAAYLITVARRLAIDRFRRRRELVRLDEPTEDGVSLVDELSDSLPSPARCVELKATAVEVRESILALPLGPRQVVLMRIEGEMAFKDIARELEVPLGTVLTWMHTATQFLKRKIGEDGDGR